MPNIGSMLYIIINSISEITIKLYATILVNQEVIFKKILLSLYFRESATIRD